MPPSSSSSTSTSTGANMKNSKSSSSKKTPLRILCFGNSLTAGFPVGHPYALKLKEKLDEAFSAYHDIEFEVEGQPGDLVCLKRGGFMRRMRGAWEVAEHKYDWTIVLGATNDIAWGVPVEDINKGLQAAWDLPLSKGSKVLALTVPETKFRSSTVLERREEINQMIREYKKPGFFHHDLNATLPYHSLSQEDRARYWSTDGVHLTADGYDRMGELVGESLVRIMRLAEAQETDMSMLSNMTPRQRRMMEDLAEAWEEERGDPRLLSQGYIVVRRKDLD